MRRTFDFEVPRLAPGLYASEVWYRGVNTDWFEVTGIQPRLTVREEAERLDWDEALLPW